MAQTGLILRTSARVAAVSLTLAGCTDAPGSATRTGEVLPPFHVMPGSLLLPATPVPASLHDTCGAAALAGLIGKLRSQIPVAVDLSRRRVSCTACPVAPEIRLDRVNILYDASTGRVTRITCG